MFMESEASCGCEDDIQSHYMSAVKINKTNKHWYANVPLPTEYFAINIDIGWQNINVQCP